MQSRLGLVVAVVVGLVPASVLVVGLLRDTLGANPIEEATHYTGEWALRFLLLTLGVSPLRAYAGWSALLPYRRLLGLHPHGGVSSRTMLACGRRARGGS